MPIPTQPVLLCRQGCSKCCLNFLKLKLSKKSQYVYKSVFVLVIAGIVDKIRNYLVGTRSVNASGWLICVLM